MSLYVPGRRGKKINPYFWCMSKQVIRPFADSEGNRIGYTFWCPGCEDYHGVWTEKRNGLTNAVWGFNGDLVKPTFTPSILIRSGHYMDGHKGDCWCDYKRKNAEKENVPNCYRCHSFVTDGKIRFLNDCTHKLAGKTVDLLPDEE